MVLPTSTLWDPLDVIHSGPVQETADAEAALAVLFDEARKECRGEGIPFTRARKDAVTFHFKASEEFIGDITPMSIAGWFHRELKILTKEGKLVPFAVNNIQWCVLCEMCTDLANSVPGRYVILKARQFGMSTLVQGLILFFCAREPGTAGTTIAHKKDATLQLTRMLRRYIRNLKHGPHLRKMNEYEIEWEHPWDCVIGLDTAENKEAKRSFTNKLIHASELAFWPYASVTRLGLMQTIAEVPGTFVFEESTANGVGGVFYNNYWAAKQGTSDFKALFYAWHEFPNYALEVGSAESEEIMGGLSSEERQGVERWSWSAGQILWRRKMISDRCDGDVLQFHQEYPSYDREAFLVSGRPVFDQHLLEERRAFAESQPLVFQGFLGYDGKEDGSEH